MATLPLKLNAQGTIGQPAQQPKNLFGGVGNLQSLGITPMGVQAKSPTQNLAPLQNTLPKSQISSASTLGGSGTKLPGYTPPAPLVTLKNNSTSSPSTQSNVATPGSAQWNANEAKRQSMLKYDANGNPLQNTNQPVTQNSSPTTQPSASQIQGQVSDLQSQQNALKNYNLTDTSQLTKDASGNYVPQNSAQNQATNQTNAPKSNDAFTSNVQNLTNYGAGQESPQVTQARQNLADFETQVANQTTEINTGGTWTSRALGEQHQGDIQNSATRSALQGALTNALTSQSQQIGAAGTAGGLAQRVGQFGVLTDPITGLPVNGQSAVQAAITGGTIQGLQQGAQATGAVSGTTNASNAANYGTQANNLSLALKQSETVQPLITQIMQGAGISSANSPLYNQPINNYLSQIQNPAAYQQYQLLLQTLQKYGQQIMGAGGVGTPSGNEAAVALSSPQGLSMQQIQSYFQTLNADGANQVSNLQQQSQQTLPGNGIYGGNPTSTVSSVPTANANTAQNTLGAGVTNPTGQVGAGVGLGVASWLVNTASNLGPQLLNSIVQGAATGTAAAKAGL